MAESNALAEIIIVDVPHDGLSAVRAAAVYSHTPKHGLVWDLTVTYQIADQPNAIPSGQCAVIFHDDTQITEEVRNDPRIQLGALDDVLAQSKRENGRRRNRGDSYRDAFRRLRPPRGRS